MRASDKTKNMRKGAGPGARRTGRRRWPAAVLAALLGSGLLISAMVTLGRRTARISASYGETPPASTAAAPQASPGAAEASSAGTLPESPAPDAQEDPDGDGSNLFRQLEWKEGQFVLVQYGEKTSTVLDDSGFTDPDTKNGHDLAAWAEMAWENQWGYVWGTFGYVLTEDQLASKLEQYPEDLGEYEDLVRKKWMGRRVVDCVGLIKSYGWYDPASNSIEYGSGDMPDTGTEGLWNAAQVKGDIDTMPDEPGVLVYSTAGHIGVYIGDGWAIEAISHDGGVVKTRVADRPWTGWLQCPYIRYDR